MVVVVVVCLPIFEGEGECWSVGVEWCFRSRRLDSERLTGFGEYV